MRTIAVLGTLDTKGLEHAFVAEQIRARGHRTLLIDMGTDGPPQASPDVTREEVAAVAGLDLAALMARHDRGTAVAAMAQAAAAILTHLQRKGEIHGVISLGGGGGTAIATAGMRALPLGFPKLMVSTLASGNSAQYIGVKDIVMCPSIVDAAGLNRISRTIFAQAAGAICGMVEAESSVENDKPVVVASIFGNTTQGVEHARRLLETAGCEVLPFHCTGVGGQTMESLIESGWAEGVLDLTTTEWADQLVGGFLSAGPRRLEAAARSGTPAVVAPGCLDMVNFHGPETVPERFAGRLFYHHNPQVTLMRTTPEECAQLGRILAEKVNLSTGPVTVAIPLRAISIISAPGQPFHDPAADRALFDALEQHLRADIPLLKLDAEINDPAFAQACAEALLAGMAARRAATGNTGTGESPVSVPVQSH